MTNIRIGSGSDIHRLVLGGRLILGGVEVDSERGAEGHSDADALLHAITDAILGALALGDIGSHFSNDDPRWVNAESSIFLKYAAGLIAEHRFTVSNVDATVSLEAPKLRPYIDQMRQNIAGILGIEVSQISVKAKTSEKVDAVGELRAVRAEAVVLLERGEN